MIIKYGSNSRTDSEIALTITKNAQRAPNGTRIGTRETWTLDGILHGTDVDDLTTNIAALEAEFSSDGKDIVLLKSDGTTETAHKITNSNTIGGVKVIQPPAFPKGDGAEYTTFRRYRIVIGALVDDGSDELMDFRETTTRTGNGGPRRVLIEVLNGPPQAQTTSRYTPVRITQRGRALGKTIYPNAAIPFYPAELSNPEHTITFTGPTNDRGNFIGFGTSWTYVSLLAFPGTAIPQIG